LHERVLAIVNLIAKYVMGANGAQISEQELVAELMSKGFEVQEINDAFSWMESTALELPRAGRSADSDISNSSKTMRVFSPEECQLIETEARGFLVRLRRMGLIDNGSEEEILDRIMAAAEEPVSLQEIKIITALTLLSRNSNQWQREIDCLMSEDWSRIYH
jgi:Smg protein